VAAVSAGPSTAFVPTGPSSLPISSMHAGNDDEGGMPSTAAVDDARARVGGGSPIGSIEKFRIPNPLAELVDIFSNFDDVVDDFFNKRVSYLLRIYFGKMTHVTWSIRSKPLVFDVFYGIEDGQRRSLLWKEEV
jgi:hypothetical protein